MFVFFLNPSLGDVVIYRTSLFSLLDSNTTVDELNEIFCMEVEGLSLASFFQPGEKCITLECIQYNQKKKTSFVPPIPVLMLVTIALVILTCAAAQELCKRSKSEGANPGPTGPSKGLVEDGVVALGGLGREKVPALRVSPVTPATSPPGTLQEHMKDVRLEKKELPVKLDDVLEKKAEVDDKGDLVLDPRGLSSED